MDTHRNRRSTRITGLVTTVAVTILSVFSVSAPTGNPVNAQTSCRTFAETGNRVCGRFLEYWEQHGGLIQQGYPISDERQEVSVLDQKTYTVQYFERAIFEQHPENQPPYDVLLARLGSVAYQRRYAVGGTPSQTANGSNPLFFPETGKTVGGAFRAYWEQHGGLVQQGYPITDAFLERSLLDGQLYTVQYFERAVLEQHPDNQPPYNILASLLGREHYAIQTYQQGRADCADFFANQRGQILAQGTNAVPTGSRNLTTYRVEAVLLPGRVNCSLPVPRSTNDGYQDQGVNLDHFWRLTISGGPFYSSLGWSVWLNDRLVGEAIGHPDMTALSVIITNPTLLQEGARIGITRGVGLPQEVEYLSERLYFDPMP
jgi:hypothetical protein